jgi:ribosomal protein L44E
MNKQFHLGLGAVILASFFVGCTYTSQGIFLDENRSAIPEPTDHFGDSAKRIVYTDQNWDAADSLWFYNTSQGSNMVPFNVFLHLEQTETQEPFRSNNNMRKYRFLPQPESWDNEYGLPVGFVEDEYQEKSYVGLTCAACHTNQINYNGVGIRIDGAPTMGDMGSMLEDLGLALQATISDEEKFQRLAKKIFPSGDFQAIENFRKELKTFTKDFEEYNHQNVPLHNGEVVPYGYARLDAFGRIFNRVLGHLTPGVDNYNSSNAPVSYPFLWDTPQHDFVQWNGISSNPGEGALGRNTGEVLGVFATFNLEKKGAIGYRSSALNRNQIRLERHVKRMTSPLWQDLTDRGILPEVDQELAKKGKKVFIEYKCQYCHESIDRTDPDRLVIAQFASLSLIETDPYMAMNAITLKGKSGAFKGKKMKMLKSKSERFGDTALAAKALTRAVTGVLLEPDHDKWLIRRWVDKIYDLIVALLDNPVKDAERHFDFEIVGDDPKYLLAYKGRPLNGIWATAPYLHNGSVRNLYELFLPSCPGNEAAMGKSCRSHTFTVGSREFDPQKVGFVSKSQKEYPGLFIFDTSKPSNSNQGHEYAVGKTPMIRLDENKKPLRDAQGKVVLEKLPPISDEKRLALVEYLKTL